MINAEILKDEIQDKIQYEAKTRKLNYNFIFFTDTDEYEHDMRVENSNTVKEYINGVFSIESSDVQNLTNGMVFATQSATLDIIFRMPDREYDIKDDKGKVVVEGWRTKVNNIRNILDTVCQQNYTKQLTDSKNKTFYVSTIASLADSGTRSQEPNIGDCFTFRINIYYMFVENGINTRERTIRIDGVIFPLQTFTETNIRTEDSNVYADSKDGMTKNIQLQQTWGLTVEFPFIETDFLNAVLEALEFDDLNKVHMLSTLNTNPIKLSTSKGGKLVFISQIIANGDTNKNIGGKLTFTEATDNYELMTLPKTITPCQVIGNVSARLVDMGITYFHAFFTSTKEYYVFNPFQYPKNADGTFNLSSLPFVKDKIVLLPYSVNVIKKIFINLNPLE